MFSNLKEIYKAGRERGFKFGEFAAGTIELGDEVSVMTMFHNSVVKIEDEDELYEIRTAEALECEQNDRQFSPFEFTACDLNQYGNNDAWDYAAAWEAFEEGIEAGIKCALRVHK